MKTFVFKARYARRLPDPVFQPPDYPPSERHVLLCPVQYLPEGLPTERTNPRKQNIDRRVYREIAKHLLNEEGTPNTFHLKNKGITILADSVEKMDEETFQVLIDPERHGIADGAHTYMLILENRDRLLEGNGEMQQYVEVRILTGLDRALVPEIAGGLNTAVQVQQMSLADLADEFRWIKEEINGQPYADEIAFRENDDGEYDVRDILMMLELFNVERYPNDSTTFPIKAYTSKEAVLSQYRKAKRSAERLRPILKDVLLLHDIVSSEARDRYNEGGGKKGGRLSFVETAKRKRFRFPFLGTEGEYRLYRGALFPMLGAFRWMAELKPDGTIGWRDSFDQVRRLWEVSAQELMIATRDTSDELGRKPNAIGKSMNHWRTLHGIVARSYYQR